MAYLRELVAKARANHDLGQIEIARTVGVNEDTINAWFRGKIPKAVTAVLQLQEMAGEQPIPQLDRMEAALIRIEGRLGGARVVFPVAGEENVPMPSKYLLDEAEKLAELGLEEPIVSKAGRKNGKRTLDQ